ncbi:MAG TPA: amino acid permease, partial [Parvularculaceae bacterium]|nr:amino acid permease [Parvularculaceae bacterium]
MSAENDAHIQPVDAAPLAGRPFGKTLTVFDLTLFTVSAIVLLDTLAATASIGPSAVTWWLLLAVFFALPMGLITAEMGTTYPEQGGLYAWIRNAFGTKWAARAAWGYFINNALWVPSVYVMFSGFLVRLFGLDLPLSTQVGINIALLWVTVAVNCASLEFGKWVPNLGALLKMIIFLTIIV